MYTGPQRPIWVPKHPLMDVSRTIGIDWSGARGRHHPGIQVAETNARGVTRILSPAKGRAWSRQGIFEMICALPAGSAVAMDSSFSLPFQDKGYYLPGLSAKTAKDLWRDVDSICAADPDFFGGSFVDAYQDHYQTSKIPGAQFERRFRQTETWLNQHFKERCETCYHLIGPSQIGKGGLATMRLLNRLQGMSHVAIWPFDPYVAGGVTIFEAFATSWRDGHRAKITEKALLQTFLDRYGCRFVATKGEPLDDNKADAALMSAGLHDLLRNGKPETWSAPSADQATLKTEGWIITGEPPCI